MGRGFGSKRRSGYVTLGAQKASIYAIWSATRIKVKAPNGTRKGKVKVAVRTSAGTSDAQVFARR
jgi:hypothetical protein